MTESIDKPLASTPPTDIIDSVLSESKPDKLAGIEGPTDEELMAELENPDVVAALEEFNPDVIKKPFLDPKLLEKEKTPAKTK